MTVFNLQSRFTLIEDKVDSIDVMCRKWSVDTLEDRNLIGITPRIHLEQLDTLLLRAATIPVILFEGHNADTHEVLHGHALLETALAVATNQADYEPRHMVRRIIETEIPVNIFRCNMSRADVIYFAKKFYNIDFV